MDKIVLFEDEHSILIDDINLLQQQTYPTLEVPSYWYNLHHCYRTIKTENSRKKIKKGVDEVDKTIEKILEQYKQLDLFPFENEKYYDYEPNRPAELKFKSVIDFESLIELNRILKIDYQHIEVKQDDIIDLYNLINNHIINISEKDIIIDIQEQKIMIPKDSSFIIADFIHFKPILDFINKKYDLIILDPPWPNYSVDRSNSYNVKFDMYGLYKLNLLKFLNENGYIAIWLTYNKKVISFVNKFFKELKLNIIAKLYWVKITTTGQPVFPLFNAHRKTYEVLLIASQQNTTPIEKYMFSVPCKIHSRKPVIQGIINTLLNQKQKQMKCLELFARCLSQHTLSLGNQSIKYNQINEHLN